MSLLAASHPTLLADFGLFGLIKEMGVDDAGVLDFYNDYFPHPLFLDPTQQFYKALGSRKITTFQTWNPLRLYRGFQNMKERIARKKLEGNMIGEGIIQGGVILFDRQGDPRAVYQEMSGQELPIEDILTALQALQAEAANSNDNDNTAAAKEL